MGARVRYGDARSFNVATQETKEAVTDSDRKRHEPRPLYVAADADARSLSLEDLNYGRPFKPTR